MNFWVQHFILPKHSASETLPNSRWFLVMLFKEVHRKGEEVCLTLDNTWTAWDWTAALQLTQTVAICCSCFPVPKHFISIAVSVHLPSWLQIKSRQRQGFLLFFGVISQPYQTSLLCLQFHLFTFNACRKQFRFREMVSGTFCLPGLLDPSALTGRCHLWLWSVTCLLWHSLLGHIYSHKIKIYRKLQKILVYKNPAGKKTPNLSISWACFWGT